MSGSTTLSTSADGSASALGALVSSAGHGASAARRRGDRLIGASRAIQRALEQIAVAGRGRFHLFVSGEDGVDKEVVGRLIHEASDWANGSFFAVDASLVPETLIARELLGSERGAISSLPAESSGAFARMTGGTVLIDHVEALPKELQQTLALALTEGRFRRVGASATTPLECRVIGSSGESLDALVQSGKLNAELAERMRLLEIRLPPLRERRDDILPIAMRALALAREDQEREFGHAPRAHGFTRDALERLRDYGWPGNERELREQICSALRLARGEEITVDDLQLAPGEGEVPSFRDAKRRFEREYVSRVLRLCKGNISRAARIAKKDRKDFYDVMHRNEIDPDDFR